MLLIRPIKAILVLVTNKAFFNAGATIFTAKLICFAHFARPGLVTFHFITAITTIHATIALAGDRQA
jgi:hypothetical protein